MSRSEILRALAARREDLTRMGVKSMAIFGSVARDEAARTATLIFWWSFGGLPPSTDTWI
jgi:predicted nucleotidyltransferase